MTRTKSTVDSPVSQTGSVSFYERVLFFVLLAVLCARPLISESFEPLALWFLDVLGVGGGTTPAATAWLDSLALTAAAAALARHWKRWRDCAWVAAGIGLLAAAVVVSIFAAADKRLALNAGASLLIGVLCGTALVSLMRARWMPRLLLAATLASGCVTATKCFTQKAYEFDQTLAYWNEHKDQITASADGDPDDPTLTNFERRLESGLTFAYQSHPNVTGSLLMMWLLMGGGALAGWWASAGTVPKDERVAAIIVYGLLCLTMTAALYFTGSAGAVVSLVVGLVVLLILGLRRCGIALRANLVTALAAAAYVAVIAAVIAFGVSRGTLPHPSLAFRWHYWTAAAETIQDAPLTGIGRANFADAYLLHKPIESVEDVRDPHNLWLSLLVELGPLGLLAGGLLIALCIRGVLRRLAVHCSTVTPGRPRERIGALQFAVAAAAVLSVQLTFSGGLLDALLALLWSLELAAPWTLALVLAGVALDRLPDSSAARGWLVAGVAAALSAALVHGLIDFALLTPAGLSLFVALAASAFGLQPAEGRAVVTRPATLLPALVGMVVVGLHLGLVTVPTMWTELRLAQMKGATLDPKNLKACLDVLEQGRAAVASDPLDAAPAREVARVALVLGSNPNLAPDERLELLGRAETFARTALERNPRSSATHARLAAIYQELEDAYLQATRPDDSIEATHNTARQWEQTVALRPSDPRTRIAAGRAWFRWWDESDDPRAARQALEHFTTALRINATRPPEEVTRLRPNELGVILKHLGVLAEAGFSVAPPSAPASAPTSPPPP